MDMYVIKRNGERAPMLFDEITSRLAWLAKNIEPVLNVQPALVTQKVVSGIYPGVKTTEIDNLAAETAAYMSSQHPDYGLLAARIAISNLQKETSAWSFAERVKMLYDYVNPKNGLHAPLVSETTLDIVMRYRERIEAALDYKRDYNFDYFGFKTLERSYLLRIGKQVMERPQDMWMRVSIGIHQEDVDAAIETYNLMSQGYFIHATPTLFNAGTVKPQMSSCFLLTMKEDSIEGIYETLKQCALISKSAGGIGLAVHNIRASNSYIRGTNGTSNGLVPMLRVFNDTARYVDQGGGKRKGAFAIYLEPWHADIFEFLDLKKNTGKEETRARDLFYGLWIPDLFMKRVESNGDWSLFCPNEAPGLSECWGEAFERLYTRYEAEGRARRTVKAQELWFAIMESQAETGTPYMLYKDSCNRKSNQQNLGTIKSSNLCTEIVEYTSADEVAVCNLCSIALPKFVDKATRTFDHAKLCEVAKVVTRNLNKVIDLNYYPVPEARNSNLRHRPIGIGVQGLADVLSMMRMPFESEAAMRLNTEIFETIYYAALSASNELAAIHGPYSSYAGSPVSRGVLQFDMWNVTPSPRWDWTALRASIAAHGIRNSLLVAPMPTASTSQILGNNECFEPYTSNIYSRSVLAGTFYVINKHLMADLMDLGLWNETMKNKIIAAGGSIQHIEEIPFELRQLYKTVWEVKQRTLIDMAAARGAFIDQSQSFNVFLKEPTLSQLTSMHFYAWKKGLKTGMYYLRSRPAADAIQFTVDQLALKAASGQKESSSSSEKEAVSAPASAQPEPVMPSPKKEAPPVTRIVAKSSDDMPMVCTREAGCLMCGS